MIYDALMLALPKYEIEEIEIGNNHEAIQKYMEKKYIENTELFNGKKQSKNDILERTEFFDEIIQSIVGGKIYE